MNNYFLNVVIVERACDGWTDLYVSKTGENLPECGTESHPCLNLTDALMEYHKQTQKEWLSCVTIHMDSSQNINDLSTTGLKGLGNPLHLNGNHTGVKVLQSGDRKKNVSLTIYGVPFYHVKLDVTGINLKVMDCKLYDSSLSLQETESISVTETDWKNVTDIPTMMLNDVSFVQLENFSIKDTNLHFKRFEKPFGAVNIQLAQCVVIKNGTFQNNYITIFISPTFDDIVKKISSQSKTRSPSVVLNVNVINGTTIMINDCNFTNNRGSDGGVISILSPTETAGASSRDISIIVNKSSFVDNKGSAISIFLEDNNEIWDPNMNVVTFIGETTFRNNAADAGAAIFGDNRGMTLIRNTTFEKNAAVMGGAIFYMFKSNLSITDTVFMSNRATYAGAAIAFGAGCKGLCNLNLTSVNFTDNQWCKPGTLGCRFGTHPNPFQNVGIQGSIGNSLYAEESNIYASHIHIKSYIDPITPQPHGRKPGYDIVYAGTEFMTYSSTVKLHDITLDFKVQNTNKRYIDYFHFSDGGDICVEGLQMSCPIGYRPKLSFRIDMRNVPYEEPCAPVDINSTRFVCKYKSNFVFGCELPDPGFYISGSGSYILDSSENFINSHAMTCPTPGGNCTHALRPLDGYWGPLIENDTARFIKCVPEFCCEGEHCVDNTSCNVETKRTGILCTKCIEGHSLSLFTEHCLPNEDCGNQWILVMMAVIIIITGVLAVFGFLPYLLKYHGLFTLMNKGIGEMKAHERNIMTRRVGPRINMRTPGTHAGRGGCDVPEIEDIENTEEGHHEGVKPRVLLIMCVILIFYYSQDVTLYHVDVVPYTLPFLEKILNTNFIHKIYNLNAGILEHLGKHFCVVKDISPSTKLMLNISSYPLIGLTLGVMYFALFLRPSNCLKPKLKDIRKNLETGFVLVAMIGYQKLTNAALRLVNCVDVHEPVLLMDSNTKCSQTRPVWIYIILCTIPFPFYLMFITGRIAKKRLNIATFNFGLIFPGIFFIYWAFNSLWKVSRQNHAQPNESRPLLEDQQSFPQSYNTQDRVTIKSRKPVKQSYDLHEEICAHLQGGYKPSVNGWFNWAGLVLLLRMMLVFFSVFIHDAVSRIGTMLIVSFTSCLLHVKLTPCKNTTLNVFSILCQIAIVAVGVCYLILATLLRNPYQSPEDDPITPALQIFIYIFSVIIPGICIILVLIDTTMGLLVFVLKLLMRLVKFICIKAAILLYRLMIHL